MGTAKIASGNIKPGLVLHLDPADLGPHATVTVADSERVQGKPHYFLCLSTNGASSRWLPLFSNASPGRFVITPGDKSGPVEWTQRSTYYDPRQVWTVPTKVVVESAASNDYTVAKNRTRVKPGALAIVNDRIVR